jgi:AAA domain
MSDTPMEQTEFSTGLQFVDPEAADDTFRLVLWGPPGEGKSVGAASAPGPIVVLSADRPGAYRTPRRLHRDTVLMETRYESSRSFVELFRFLRDHPTGKEARTVVLDPFTGIYDKLVEELPKRSDGEPNWQAVNKKILDFVQALRGFPCHIVLVAYEKLNDGKKGDGKLYPALGGPALINKIMGEMDIVAHVEREGEGKNAKYMARVASGGGIVGKDSTDALGERRELNLTEWFETVAAFEKEELSDLPWESPGDEGPTDPAHDGVYEADRGMEG